MNGCFYFSFSAGNSRRAATRSLGVYGIVIPALRSRRGIITVDSATGSDSAMQAMRLLNAVGTCAPHTAFVAGTRHSAETTGNGGLNIDGATYGRTRA